MPAITVATDCSGMDTMMMALHALGVEARHLFSCDTDQHAKATILANFHPEHFYDDLTKRDNSRAPKADVYLAGFPCQPFSPAGNKQGFADRRGRGRLCFKIVRYIKEALPRVFVLENVSGLKEVNGGGAYNAIMKSLEALGKCNVQAGEMNTKDHGIPQNRRRIYFVGIRKDCDQGTFSYPSPLPSVDLNKFLDAPNKTVTMMCLPPETQTTAHRNVQLTVKALLESKEDPFRDPWVIDCDSSTNRMKYWKGLSPCLTYSRYKGHWITNRGRRLTLTERMRLMGMMTPDAGFKVVVSETQLGKQIGNAMSCNVLERLLVRLLPAAGLVAAEDLTDRWESAASAGAPPTFPCFRPVPGARPLATSRAPRRVKAPAQRPETHSPEPAQRPEAHSPEERDIARLEVLAARLEVAAAARLGATAPKGAAPKDAPVAVFSDGDVHATSTRCSATATPTSSGGVQRRRRPKDAPVAVFSDDLSSLGDRRNSKPASTLDEVGKTKDGIRVRIERARPAASATKRPAAAAAAASTKRLKNQKSAAEPRGTEADGSNCDEDGEAFSEGKAQLLLENMDFEPPDIDKMFVL